MQFARCAEEAGIESVLLSFSRYEPDTIFVACAVGQVTTKLEFIVAYRLGLMQPRDVRAADQHAFGVDRWSREFEYRRGQLGGGATRLWRLSGPR